MSVYAHTAETVPLYKILPYYTHQINTNLTQTDINKFRFHVGMRDQVGVTTAGVFEPSPTTSITGGWNTTDMSSQDSITWIYLGVRINQFFSTADDIQSNFESQNNLKFQNHENSEHQDISSYLFEF